MEDIVEFAFLRMSYKVVTWHNDTQWACITSTLQCVSLVSASLTAATREGLQSRPLSWPPAARQGSADAEGAEGVGDVISALPFETVQELFLKR